MKTPHLTARSKSSKRRLSVRPVAGAPEATMIAPSSELARSAQSDQDPATAWDRSNLDPAVLSQRIRAGATVH